MKRYLRIGAGLIGGLIVGCGGNGAHFGEYPNVRIFNAVDGRTVAVDFKDLSGSSLGTSVAVPPGTVSAPNSIVKNTNATATILAGGVGLVTSSSNLYRLNDSYSLYCGGVPGRYTAIALNDNLGLGPTAGSADVRAVHLGANSAAVDIYVVPAGQAPSGGGATFSNLTYGNVGSTPNASTGFDSNNYTTTAVVGGLYSVLVTAHGSASVIATANSYLGQQIYYTIVVFDAGPGATGVQILSDRH